VALYAEGEQALYSWVCAITIRPGVKMDKERFEYARSLYQREFEIKERLEKKAAALFGLPSTFVGIFLLKKDSAQQLESFFHASTNGGYLIVSISLLALFLCLLAISITMAVASLAIQQYQKEYPNKLYAFLFEPSNRYLVSEAALYAELGGRFAIATEHNARMNETKAVRLKVSVITLYGAVILLFLFLGLYLISI